MAQCVYILCVYLADQLAHAFDVLQSDLQTEHGRHLFLHYRALPVVLSFIRPANKVRCFVAMMIQVVCCER